MFRKIKQSVLDGNDLRKTAKICEIIESTLYSWHSDNYLNLRDKIEGWKRDRKINLANLVVDEMLAMPVETLEWTGRGEDAEQVVVTNPSLIKIKQDTAKFVLETLDKDNYSKRNELSGVNGKDLFALKEDEKNKLDELLRGTKTETN